MLAQILKEMWVDPEVLEALSEEQKKVLFLKMREEQVRRWRAHEEKEEREGRTYRNTKPKKASSKQVSWLLSRDGDVSVTVIGEVDEFRSSKVLQNHMNRLLSDNRNCIQTVDLLPGSDAQQLSIKDDAKLPLTDVNEDPGSPINQSSEEEVADCSTDEDPKDPDEDDGVELNLVYRPHFRRSLLLRSHQSEAERVTPQDGETRRCRETSESEGRVAHLKKAFADDACSKPPACKKPPIPVKPAHLQKSGTALVH
ncbi:SH2 domain-containing protein 4A [Poeciliopsis prolifica]|uniref:SH2 domain-containing protein 4A n=1 Tax=Poeciliopsis prolifica TaxID=188132 RepID=UPI0024137704|nr:SH2 domain-containing protein 4A [Poeciliopsis prolifica]XP_054890655.1 SH2 domain-containing protein 4A [Poeciliopsis prolifica]